MRISQVNLIQRLMILLAGGLSYYYPAAAQNKNTADTTKTLIYILNNEYGEYIQGDGRTVHKLMNNVKLLHGSDTLYCDSAFFYQEQNSVEAFGNVAIYQADGTTAFAEYMRYTGNNKKVFMRSTDGDVELSDGKGSTLWSKEIYYDLTTKTGTYKRGGTLQSDATILSSINGIYNLKTKDARFQNNVDVSDPEYHVISSDLGYNTATKIVRFFGPSVVTNDKSILQTSNGIYNTITRTSHFTDRSSILNESQYIEADTLDYNRESGLAIAIGNVIAIDTVQKSTLYCGKAIYNEITGHLLAFQSPVLKIRKEKDSLFIKSDTFFSAPVIAVRADSLTDQGRLQKTAEELRAGVADTLSANPLKPDILQVADSTSMVNNPDTGQTGQTSIKPLSNAVDSVKDQDSSVHESRDMLAYGSTTEDTLSHDTANAPLMLKNQQMLDSTASSYNNAPGEDSSKPRYFIGYSHVRIFSDSLQGRCDSIYYSQQDSLMRMYKDPVLWPRKSQIMGEIIYLQMANNELKELIVPKNAIMISQSGPRQANMFDQIQGNTIRGYFVNNSLDSLIAQPNASSVYFIKDDSNAYVGCNEAQGERIEIIFKDEKIQKIYYRKDVVLKTTPMKDIMPASIRLSRFTWRESERPETLGSFLEGATLPHPAELLINPGSGPAKSPSPSEMKGNSSIRKEKIQIKPAPQETSPFSGKTTDQSVQKPG